ncbi:hypothetical protein [Deinococcus ruber]|uniref:Uncharacterized protein n=1 Tax=Deinococcus ruber TaxID=1848197 RepID=A0A918KXE0_9DEIO|nr:hypothetical protein [Deinococcus ruber]GGR39814.1 hypothetical protein GCM10008957_55700 [Deinococcus ruber]
MPDLSSFTPTELLELLEQINTSGQSPPELQLPHMTQIKLALLLNTDPAFKTALIAIIQSYLAGTALPDVDDL